MGTSTSCQCVAPVLVVHVPCPNDLRTWDRMSQSNVVRALEYLEQVQRADARAAIQSRLATFYDVEVMNPNVGKATTVHIAKVALELATVLAMLRKQWKTKKKYKPLMDIRREAALCAAHSKLLARAPLLFAESMDLQFLNSQLDAPFTLHQWMVLRDVFSDMNRSKSGTVSLPELLQWTSRFQSSCAVSSYHYLFMESVQPAREHRLTFIEWVATLAEFCVLNQEGLVTMTFQALIDSTNSQGAAAIDITAVATRFTSAPDLFDKGIGMPLVKAMARLYSSRLEKSASSGVKIAEEELLHREAFDRLLQAHPSLTDQLMALHHALRSNTFGHRVWNQRARDKTHAARNRYHVAAQPSARKRKRLHLMPPRQTEKMYRLKKVGRRVVKPAKLRLGADGSLAHSSMQSLQSPGSALSARSARSTRSIRSTRSGRSSRVRRDSSRASTVRRTQSRHADSPNTASPHTPQSVSLGERSNSDSNSSTQRDLVTHQSVPSHLSKLSEEATAEFARVLRESQSWSHSNQRASRSSKRAGSGRHSHRSNGSGAPGSKSWRSGGTSGEATRRTSARSRGQLDSAGRRRGTSGGTFSFIVQAQQQAAQARQQAQQRQREAEAAIAAARVAAEQQADIAQRRVIAAASMPVPVSMPVMAAPMNPFMPPGAASPMPYAGGVYGISSPMPQQRAWPAASFVSGMMSPAARPPGAFASVAMEAHRRSMTARRDDNQLAADHAAFDSGSFPVPGQPPSSGPIPPGPPPAFSPRW